MTQPPQPVRRTIQPLTGKPASQTQTVQGRSIADPVSVASARPRASMLRDPRERIQIVGDSNSGKTFAYLTQASILLAEHKANNTFDECPRFFILDTDETMPAMLGEGGEFHGLYYEDGGNVYVYPCDNWADFVGSLHTIAKQVRRHDWIVFDVINQGYDLAVSEVAKAHGIDYVNETFRRIQTKEGFGAFPSDIWQAVSVIFDGAMRVAIASIANVLWVQHIADYVEQRSSREVVLMFDQLGVKPQGAKKISRMANTVVFLYTVRSILRDERKKRIGSDIVRKMVIVKDRGKLTYAAENYDKDFFTKLAEIRSSGVTTKNITDPEAAAIIVSNALASIRASDSGLAPVLQTQEFGDADGDES